MANSRRDFLKKSAMAVVAAGIPIELSQIVNAQQSGGKLAAGFATPASSLTDPLMYLKQSSFEAYVNSIFEVSVDGWGVLDELSLIRVTSPLTSQSIKGKKSATTMVREPVVRDDHFSLLFRSANSIPQEVYTVNHAALGQFRLLIVPVVNRDSSAFYYEAIINRSR